MAHKWKKEVEEGLRSETFQDADALLALRMKEGASSQGMHVASKLQKARNPRKK